MVFLTVGLGRRNGLGRFAKRLDPIRLLAHDADRLPSRSQRVAKLTGSPNHLKPSKRTLGYARWLGGVPVQRHGYGEERFALGYIRVPSGASRHQYDPQRTSLGPQPASAGTGTAHCRMSFVSPAFCTIVNACQLEICFIPLENHYRNQLRHKIRLYPGTERPKHRSYKFTSTESCPWHTLPSTSRSPRSSHRITALYRPNECSDNKSKG
jgi:hypothetical protein